MSFLCLQAHVFVGQRRHIETHKLVGKKVPQELEMLEPSLDSELCFCFKTYAYHCVSVVIFIVCYASDCEVRLTIN